MSDATIRFQAPTSFIDPGRLSDAFASSMAIHFVALVVFAHLRPFEPHTKIDVTLIHDPGEWGPTQVQLPEDPFFRPDPPTEPDPAEGSRDPQDDASDRLAALALPDQAAQTDGAAVDEPEPAKPSESLEGGLRFLRSDGLVATADVASPYFSDRSAKSVLEGRVLSALEIGPEPSTPGKLPSPETGVGKTGVHSNDLSAPTPGDAQKAEEAKPAPQKVGPAAGVPAERPAERPEQEEAVPSSQRAPSTQAEAAPAQEELDYQARPGLDPLRAAVSELQTASLAAPQADEADAEPREAQTAEGAAQTGEIGPVADAMDPQPEARPDAGSPELHLGAIGKPSTATRESSSRDGALGRHTLPGVAGSQAQLQAAPEDVPLDVGAMLSVRGHPLGPWFALLDQALRARWQPPADLRARTSGTTEISFWVSRTGKISEVEVVRSSGNGELDALALAAIPAKVAAPSPFDGTAVHVKYSFRTLAR